MERGGKRGEKEKEEEGEENRGKSPFCFDIFFVCVLTHAQNRWLGDEEEGQRQTKNVRTRQRQRQ